MGKWTLKRLYPFERVIIMEQTAKRYPPRRRAISIRFIPTKPSLLAFNNKSILLLSHRHIIALHHWQLYRRRAAPLGICTRAGRRWFPSPLVAISTHPLVYRRTAGRNCHGICTARHQLLRPHRHQERVPRLQADQQKSCQGGGNS